MSPEEEGMDATAGQLLTTFVKAANLSTGVAGLHTLDWERLHDFIIYVHKGRIGIRDVDVTERLRALGVRQESASRLAASFSRPPG